MTEATDPKFDELVRPILGGRRGYLFADRSVETAFGLPRHVFLELAKPATDVTREEAEQAFHDYLWTGLNLHLVAASRPEVAVALFEASLFANEGLVREFAQEAFNALAGGSLRIDGAIGEVTLSAFAAINQATGERVAAALRSMVTAWLISQVGHDRADLADLEAWLNRQ